MAIRIQQLSMNPVTTGGIRPNTQANSFKDTFTRANAANLGTAWAGGPLASSSAGTQLLASISGNLAVFTGSLNNSESANLWPVPLAWMSQIVQNQFAELTLSNNGVTSFALGPAVVMSPLVGAATTQGFYDVEWNGTNLKIIRNVFTGVQNAALTSTVLSTIVATIANGDVLRLEATNAAGVWTLNVKKNGTSLGTITDSTLIQGVPGMYAAVAIGAVSQTFALNEYAGGRL